MRPRIIAKSPKRPFMSTRAPVQYQCETQRPSRLRTLGKEKTAQVIHARVNSCLCKGISFPGWRVRRARLYAIKGNLMMQRACEGQRSAPTVRQAKPYRGVQLMVRRIHLGLGVPKLDAADSSADQPCGAGEVGRCPASHRQGQWAGCVVGDIPCEEEEGQHRHRCVHDLKPSHLEKHVHMLRRAVVVVLAFYGQVGHQAEDSQVGCDHHSGHPERCQRAS
eukprot:scaffold243025_cov33-Tisochrysis_lutea.AAC.3